ncbi:hypothetical protein P6166_17015 [Stenotrophomonas sp. HITSZ_GD]|uniref:hypothetical protein n=1 Tax=Stenotrophomonas sp. HITSZ_GD TaxID=3037248 RepID=UPI00240E4D15|nr:hypothetical protein [Stenotrophomonas sp. HITSZ_GD]MDG2527056.1 hypothetical protein [Stenotrophomonas sp. HITSZ_GD]
MLKPLPAGMAALWARTLGLLGLGMLVWACVSTALLQGRGDAFLNLRPLQDRTLGVGLVLAALWLGPLWRRPDAAEPRIWRPRALAALGVAMIGDIALIVLLHLPTHSPGLIAIAGAIACMGALAAICMVTLALETPRSQWLLPAQCALALLAGAVLFFAFMAWLWPGQMAAGGVPSLVLLGAIAAALLLATWLGEGRDALLPLPARWPRWMLLLALLAIPLLLVGVLAIKPGLQKPVWGLAVLAMAAVIGLDARQRIIAPGLGRNGA